MSRADATPPTASATVPDSPALNADRIAASAACRAEWAGSLDVPYGAEERQRWDIFPAADPGHACLVFLHGGVIGSGSD